MSTQVVSSAESSQLESMRRLLVVWQNPTNRRFTAIGQLDQLADGRFAYRYLSAAQEDSDFFPLDEYPNVNSVYVSDRLPVFFANRVMSPERQSYGDYLGWLGLDSANKADVPFEILARSGGGRATDTFHIVDEPIHGGERFSSRFFVSGVRHIAGAAERVCSLEAGAKLALHADLANAANPRAVLVDADESQSIGWVPDWLCDRVNSLLEAGWELNAVAERVSPDAPEHVRVLCRIDAVRRPS